MADKLYQEDAYLKEFEAEVVQTKENAVALDRTAFYPGGGGQPHDRGWLLVEGSELPVSKVKAEGGDVWHFLEGEMPSEGASITGRLDWDRRYRLMRTHTAMHILCGVVWRDYEASVTGGNMQPLKGRMDFEFERMQKELVQEIEQKINQEVDAARTISTRILPREQAFKIPDLIRTRINLLPEAIQQVRVVEIDGLDLQADGGTHVANTREVGKIRILDYKSKGKINKRIVVGLEE